MSKASYEESGKVKLESHILFLDAVAKYSIHNLPMQGNEITKAYDNFAAYLLDNDAIWVGYGGSGPKKPAKSSVVNWLKAMLHLKDGLCVSFAKTYEKEANPGKEEYEVEDCYNLAFLDHYEVSSTAAAVPTCPTNVAFMNTITNSSSVGFVLLHESSCFKLNNDEVKALDSSTKRETGRPDVSPLVALKELTELAILQLGQSIMLNPSERTKKDAAALANAKKKGANDELGITQAERGRVDKKKKQKNQDGDDEGEDGPRRKKAKQAVTVDGQLEGAKNAMDDFLSDEKVQKRRDAMDKSRMLQSEYQVNANRELAEFNAKEKRAEGRLRASTDLEIARLRYPNPIAAAPVTPAHAANPASLNVNCPGCKVENAADSNFCLACPLQLRVTCTQCGKNVLNHLRCTHCGNSLRA